MVDIGKKIGFLQDRNVLVNTDLISKRALKWDIYIKTLLNFRWSRVKKTVM